MPVEMEDLPAVLDLTSGDPPLSPNILGLFRGSPLGEPCEPEPDAKPGAPCRSIALYRKNLGRAVKTKAELIEQISVTVLHEVGHLSLKPNSLTQSLLELDIIVESTAARTHESTRRGRRLPEGASTAVSSGRRRPRSPVGASLCRGRCAVVEDSKPQAHTPRR